jgi:outer membrane protein assembly factor BamB
MRRSPALVPPSLLMALALGAAEIHAADWPQFRGPDRDGISTETGLVDGWGENGPRELWRSPIGAGYSAIIAVGDRLFTMDSDDSREYVIALDRATGREAWRTAVGELFENDYGNGPRSTPTWSDGALFALSSVGNLTALSADEGKLLWRRELQADFGSEVPNWAFSSSALVMGDRVFVEVGGAEDRTIAAFNRESGELDWTAGSGGIAYSSPIVVPFNGVTQIVFLTQNGLSALTPEGETLWTSEFVPELGIKPASPVFVAPDLIFASASYDAGAKVVRLVAEGESVGVEEVWEHRLMRNHFNGSVAVDGHLCGFDKAFLKCIDAATGETSWTRRGLGKGSLIKADGKLIVLSERGKLALLAADPAEVRELATHQALTGRCWTQPTLAGGSLYLRNGAEIVAFDLAAAASSAAGGR